MLSDFHEHPTLHGSTWVVEVGSTQLQQSLDLRQCRMWTALFGAWQSQRLASAGAGGTAQRCKSERLGVEMAIGEGHVLKVHHDDMRCLMDSDVRNLGRLAAYVRTACPLVLAFIE